jgi:gamma-glutamylputrescine oxidase
MQVDSAPSPWLANPPPRRPRLEADLDVDVAVVGAGFTGLSSALTLAREGMSVAVLESETIGFGASGRNAGHLTPTIGKDLPTLTRMYGEQRVRGLLHMTESAISHVEALIADHAIDCDYEPVGNVIAAVHPKQHAAIDRAAEAARTHGIPGELLDGEAMRDRGLPRAFTRGYFEPHGGLLDPAKYVHGLARAAEAAGAVIYEGTHVRQIREGETVEVDTDCGRVRCRNLVIGTNAYTPSLGRLPGAGLRIQVQLFMTTPLSPEQLDRVGWAGRQGIYTAHEMLENFRLTADDRILGGSKAIRAGFGRRVLPDVDPGVAGSLEAVFRQRFPELHDVAIAQHWGGPIFLGLDFLPWVARAGQHGNVLHALAYAGHGIAHASYAGVMLRDLLTGKDGPGSALWARRRLGMPPEPVRWLAFQGLTRFFEALDRRVDRAI